MIELQGLRKTFNDQVAVADLSFTIREGQTLALVGTSGSGKTTCLKMLNRLIEPSAGDILLKGRNIKDMPLAAMRRQMGYVIQHIGLFPHFTIAKNIAVVPQLLSWPAEQIKRRTADLLNRLGLPAGQFLNRYPHELSGGQQQRVGIARALAAKPPVLLMDEPFSALDQITRQELRQDFLQLDALKNLTTVIVTHDMEEAFELADQICLLDNGQLQQLGSPRQLLFQPSNNFVRNFLRQQRLKLAYLVLQVRDILPNQETSRPEGSTLIPFPDDASLQSVQDQLLRSDNNTYGKTASGDWFSLADLTQTTLHFLRQST